MLYHSLLCPECAAHLAYTTLSSNTIATLEGSPLTCCNCGLCVFPGDTVTISHYTSDARNTNNSSSMYCYTCLAFSQHTATPTGMFLTCNICHYTYSSSGINHETKDNQLTILEGMPNEWDICL